MKPKDYRHQRCKNEECDRGNDPAPENISMMTGMLGLHCMRSTSAILWKLGV